VVTSLPEIPVHVENFASAEALREDDLSIIARLRVGGMLIINSDEPLAADLPARFKVPVMTYGSTPAAQVRFETVTTAYSVDAGRSVPIGVSCKLSSGGNTVPVSLKGVLGVTHVYPIAAAVAVGLSQQVPLLSMVQALASHEPPRGRMSIIEGVHGTTIIDDTYNASPVATDRALETLAGLEVSGKRVAVLGEMRELGSFSESEHRRIGAKAAALGVTYVVAVGPLAQPLAAAAVEAGMDAARVFTVAASTEVAAIVEPLLAPGDVVLVKGSQGVRAERVVAALMADAGRRTELLVRQDAVWENR
jgi:UDP-N-acetylmuramoyl-tripeptide--D-alanyl-D-alanine ligase